MRRPAVAAIVEDVEWMLAGGENLSGALRRLGLTSDALWARLKRQDRLDLFERLSDGEVDGEMRSRCRAALRARVSNRMPLPDAP